MEVIRGCLDAISRPASREQTGSRVSSVCLPPSDRHRPVTPFALAVLTSDTAAFQGTNNWEETTLCSSGVAHKDGVDLAEDEREDPKLQRAIEEMMRLDEILSVNICKEKEAKHRRKQLIAKLWQELLENLPDGHSGCIHEAVNTRLFLALEGSSGPEEEEDFIPVFNTQAPDCDNDGDKQHVGQSEKTPDNMTESFGAGCEETETEQREDSRCGASKAKQKQRDFVKRNIELVSGERGQVLLTQAEKERLAELLRETDQEEEDSARGTDSKEDLWAVSVLTSHGYTPLPSDLEQLIDIDSKIRLLLPVEECSSMQSSYTNLGECRVRGSVVGLERDGHRQPGETVQQDIKERRAQERRLQEIQQQLEILSRGQEMTNESAELSEEQLHRLLDECELTDPEPEAGDELQHSPTQTGPCYQNVHQ